MGFFANRDVGIIEKASAIAVKHNTTYDPCTGTFKGQLEDVAKSAAKLTAWTEAQARRARHDRRQDY